jgi:hypothetical protein
VDTDPRDRWGVAGFVPFLASIGWLAWKRHTLTEYGWGEFAPPVTFVAMTTGMAFALVEVLRIVGAAFGRGAPLPGARYGGGARIVLAVVIPALVESFAEDSETPSLLNALVVVLVLEATSHLRGPGLLWVAMLLVALDLLPSNAMINLASAGSCLAVGATLLRCRLRASRLARCGIEPWAPSDLITLPYFVGTGLIMARGWGLSSWSYEREYLTATILAATALEVAALIYLDRRLRAAEARAASLPR